MAKLQSSPLLIALQEAFDLEELRTLCFDLQIDFDSLRGEGKEAKARELILFVLRHNQSTQLVDRVCELRPHLAEQLRNLNVVDISPGRTLPRLVLVWKRAKALWHGWSWPKKAVASVVSVCLLLLIGSAGYRIVTSSKLDVPAAGPGERLILISTFKPPPTGADILPEQRIFTTLEKLQKEFPDRALRVEPVQKRVIATDAEAKAWALAHRATLVIWGWYDAEGIEAHVTLSMASFACGGGQLSAIERDESWKLNRLLPAEVEMVSEIVLAWLEFDNEQYESAIKLWTQVIAKVTDRSLEDQKAFGFDRLYYCRAIAYEEQNDPLAAEADFAQAEKINPDNILAVIENAEAAYLAAEYDLALTKAQTVFNIVPAAQGYSLGKALWIAARSQNELGNLTEAVALAEQSVKAYPELDIFWLTLSDLYLKQHNWSQASTSAQNAIDNASSSAWSYFNLGRASLHSGDIQSARQAYEDAFAKLPEDAAQEVEASIAELEEDRVQYPELTQEINGLIAFLHTK